MTFNGCEQHGGPTDRSDDDVSTSRRRFIRSEVDELEALNSRLSLPTRVAGERVIVGYKQKPIEEPRVADADRIASIIDDACGY